MTEKERRGRKIYARLNPLFNIAPFIAGWDNYGLPVIDYEKLADTEFEGMKRAEPVDDEPVKRIELKESLSMAESMKIIQWAQGAMTKICGVFKK